MKVSNLLELLQEYKSHMAIVKDEFGGTLGIVTMAAIAEALVGTTMDAVEADLVKDGTWSIGDITTSATLSDFADYYFLAQVAYNNALAGKE